MTEYVKFPGVYHILLEEFCTDLQIENLRKLSDYLLQLPDGYEHFDMSHYYTTNGDAAFLKYYVGFDECGSVACAIGHGPAAGVPIFDTDSSWPAYAIRSFGFNELTGSFIFGYDWHSIDNTPRGAANRIQYTLQHGLIHYSELDTDVMNEILVWING